MTTSILNSRMAEDVSDPRELFPAILRAQGDDEKRKVRSGRRRPTGKSVERERAEAPRRRRQRPPAPPSAGGPSGPRPASPRPLLGSGGRPPTLITIAIIVILVVCGLPLMYFFGGGDEGESTGDQATPRFEETPTEIMDSAANEFAAGASTTSNNEPFIPPPPSTEGQTWLIMLYQDADDQVLEQDIYIDLNEAERVGSTDRVQIVAQVDRFRAGYQGDGDWTSARRYYVTQDDDLNRINSQLVADLGEVNMADSETLVDFVRWAVDSFPADKYILIMADHGMGWPGGWSDPDPGGRGDASIPLASALGNQLYLMELDAALAEIRDQTGIGQFELIGMDACLMGHVEVFTALAPHARYAVASQEVEPAVGWAYTGFLSELVANPDMSGADLSRIVVESYISEDQRLVDDQARAEFAGRGSPLGDLFSILGGGSPSAAQLAQQLEQNITLTAVDLAAMPNLVDSLNNLAFILQDADQRTVAEARTYAQSFTSVFGRDIPPSYIDLAHFVQLLSQNSDTVAVSQATEDVVAAIQQAVVAEKHGPKVRGATGISIYFPNSQLYRNPATGPQSYTAIARRFAEATLWDDFLAFHYTGRSFEFAPTELAVPDAATSIRAPGAGPITVSPLTLSSDEAGPGEPVLLSADIGGDSVGYVFLWVGFYDQAANSIFVADTDFLESADNREIDGVIYPDWGEGEFTMEFEWEPLMFAINDGTDSVVVALQPQSYGATAEEATYSIDGIYTFTNGESRYARLLFQNGVLRQVFGFTGPAAGTGAPREIIPQPGDTFTVLEEWLDLNAAGQVVETTSQEGGTLTFSERTLTWEALDAAPGEYIVGYIVEDLDGNQVEVYETITVR